jgi:hypothetical protein
VDRLIGLVLLRWRTDIRGLTWARERLLGVLLMVPGLILFSALGSILVFLGSAALDRSHPGALLPLLSALATLVGVFWSLSPLLAGVAFTESHDISRLLHFPIPVPTLVASSLIANMAQPIVLAEVPILLSLSLALSGDPLRFPMVLAGVLLAFATVLAAAQVTGLVLHELSRNRRLHDIALFLGLILGVGVSLAPLVLVLSAPSLLSKLFRFLVDTDLFALSPFAWGVRAAVFAGRGEAGGFFAYGVAALLATTLAMGLSTALIGLLSRGELRLGSPGGPGGASRARMLFTGPVGALLEKDLRVGWRDPALKATLFVGLVGPLVFLFFLSQVRHGAPSGASILFLATFVGLSAFGSNALGFERRGVALLLGFPVERFWLLVGKNLAALSYRLPGLILLFLAGLLLAPLSYLPAAITIALSTQLLATGVDNYLSILFPAAVPEPGKNPYGGPAAGGRGLGMALLTLVLVPVVLLISAPFAFLAWLPVLLRAPLLWLGSLPLALAGAASVYAMLVAGAARLLSRREPELLERILGEA